LIVAQPFASPRRASHHIIRPPYLGALFSISRLLVVKTVPLLPEKFLLHLERVSYPLLRTLPLLFRLDH
jgi:hypothetical protein